MRSGAFSLYRACLILLPLSVWERGLGGEGLGAGGRRHGADVN